MESFCLKMTKSHLLRLRSQWRSQKCAAAAAAAEKAKAQELVNHAQLEWQDAVTLLSIPELEYKEYLLTSKTISSLGDFEDRRLIRMEEVNQRLHGARIALETAVQREKDVADAALLDGRAYRQGLGDAGLADENMDTPDADSEVFWKLFPQGRMTISSSGTGTGIGNSDSGTVTSPASIKESLPPSIGKSVYLLYGVLLRQLLQLLIPRFGNHGCFLRQQRRFASTRQLLSSGILSLHDLPKHNPHALLQTILHLKTFNV
jgi:hypothetical protein